MKSLLKYVSILGVVATVLALTACSGQPNFDVTLDNGGDLAIEADHFQLTNQEMFEIIASGYINGMNPGVSAILDWADSIILADLVEIDEAIIAEELEFFENFFDDDELEALLMAQGFDHLDAYFANVRLGMMREQAVHDAVEIDEADIQAAYDEWFGSSEDESDEPHLDEDEPDATEPTDADLDTEEPEDEVPEFEEVRDIIEDILRSESLETPGFEQEILATLRAEAGLTIYSSYFATRYESFLDAWMVEGVDVATGNNNAAVASVDGHYLTVDELFNTVVAHFALTPQSSLLNYIDLNILDHTYDVNRSVVRGNISQEKLDWLELFYPRMESLGLLTESQIFDFFLLSHLQELVVEEHLTVSDERVQELYDNYVPSREVQHILVDDYDLAADLIARLQAASEDEMPDLFADLALEYSHCPSSEERGSLGHLSIPSGMVIEFEEAAFALPEGTFSTTPVETTFGYHVILVSDFAPTPALAQLREQEIQRLHNNPRYLDHVMFGLRADHNITFHHEQLRVQYEIILEQNRSSIED